MSEKVLFIDTNLGLEHALRFGRDGYETFYAVVHGQAYPKMADEICGYGFDEIKKIWDWGQGLEEGAKTIIFTDSGFGYLAEWLRSRGYHVIGADGISEKLELDRYYVRRVFEKLDIGLPEAKVVRGVNGVVSAVEEAGGEEVFVKISRVRGDVETFKTNDPYEAEIMLSRGGFKIFGDDVIFILEKKLEGIGIGCFDKETDILTDRGWMSFEELFEIIAQEIKSKYGEAVLRQKMSELAEKGWMGLDDIDVDIKVLSLDLKTMKAEYVPIKRYIKYHYTGKMVYHDGRVLNFLVTPNHTLWVRRHIDIFGSYGKKREVERDWRRVVCSDLVEYKYYLPKCFRVERERVEYFDIPEVVIGQGFRGDTVKGVRRVSMDVWLRFLAWFLSEGSILEKGEERRWYSIYIAQENEEYKHRIEDVLNALGVNWNINSANYRFFDKQIWVWLRENCYEGGFGAHYKKVPEFIKRLPPEQIKIFLDEFLYGDGSEASSGTLVYVTKSKRLADDLHELILLAGEWGTVKERDDECERVIEGRTIYPRGRLYVVNRWVNGNKYLNILRKNLKEVEYSGNVYDVEVEPYHTILVRRNGKPFWSSNCDAWFNGKEFIGIVAETIELKGTGNITKFVPIEDSLWYGVLQKLEPWLRKNGYVGMFCMEGFYDGNVVKVTDVIPRFPYICSYAYPKVINNYSEFLMGVASGEDVIPEPKAKYSTQIGVYTDDPDTWRRIRYDRDDGDMIAYRRVIKDKEGHIWFVPGDYVVGVGISANNVMRRAINEAIIRAEAISSSQIYTMGREFRAYIYDVIEQAHKLGYDF